MADVTILSLGEVLLNLNGGGTVEEIQNNIREAVTRARMTGKAAAVTIQLAINPIGGPGTRQVTITDKITVKLPDFEKALALFYATDEGDLSRSNPDQPSMFGGVK